MFCSEFILVSGAELWKGCTSVSNAGKKRGRGKQAGKGLTKDLNQGQIIGQGRKNLILPGLNSPVKRGYEIVKSDRGTDDPSWYVQMLFIQFQIEIITNICFTRSQGG